MSSLHQALADDDGILEVAALPAHEGDQHVLPQRQLAVVGRRAVGDHLAGLTRSPASDDRPLVDAGALVGAHELAQRIDVALAVVLQHHDLVGGRRRDTSPAPSASSTWPLCRRHRCSMPVATIGASGASSGTAWRCMFEPIRARLASSCSRNGISAVETLTTCFGRHVHVVDAVRRLAARNSRRSGTDTRSLTNDRLVKRRVRLRDQRTSPPRRPKVIDLVARRRATDRRMRVRDSSSSSAASNAGSAISPCRRQAPSLAVRVDASARARSAPADRWHRRRRSGDTTLR